MGDPRVSVIVPVPASSDLVPECIKGLVSQSYARKELIVACRPQQPPPLPEGMEGVRVVKADAEAGAAGLINRGMKAARGDILVLLMPNCVPTQEDWLANLIRPFKDPGVGAVVAACSVPGRRKLGLAASLLYSVAGPDAGTGRREPVERELLSHACDAFRADLLRGLEGPYAENVPAPAEVVDLSVRITATGSRIVLNPSATILYYDPPGRRSLRSVFRKAFEHGQADAALAKTYGIDWLGAHVYAAALLSLFLLPIGLFGLPVAVVLAGALFLWGWFLPFKLPLVRWEWPVAILNGGSYVLLAAGMPSEWTARLFDPRQWHPAIVRQWWILAAMVGSYMLLLARAGARCALRALFDGRSVSRAAAIFVLSMAWYLLCGVGRIKGQVLGHAIWPER